MLRLKEHVGNIDRKSQICPYWKHERDIIGCADVLQKKKSEQ